MNITARSRILSHIILALFLCALAMAASTRPLSRTWLSGAPRLTQVHQGLERYTYFEVPGSGVHSQALYDLLVRSDLPLMAAAHAQSFHAVRAHQPVNWPIAFCSIYRHIPPSKSGDSDLSA
jgi:hypothetical protein